MKVRIGINKFKGSYEEMIEAVRKDAPMFNEMALTWKIWLVNKEESLLAGVYLCEDEEALERSLQVCCGISAAPRSWVKPPMEM